MAIAYQPPHIAAQQAKQADLARRLESPDPVTRYKAREELLSGYSAQFGRAMAKQSEQTAKAYQAELRRCEQAERENAKYKPLSPSANITK